MAEAIPLAELHPLEYEHPFDAKALDTLENTPGLGLLIRQYNKHMVERQLNVLYTGSNIRVTSKNYPEIYKLFDRACDIVNLPARPDFYLEWDYAVNGFTTGVDHPIVVLTSGAIDLLTEDELMFLIGHEFGHIKSRHTLYHAIGETFPVLADVVGQATFGASKLISTPVRLALLRWSRMSEFTADRAGMLCCQNLEVAAGVMMKLAGMPVNYYPGMKLDSFLDQAREFEELDYDKLNKLTKYFLVMSSTHPWTVMRAAELLKWIEGGEYQQVLERKTRSRVTIKLENGYSCCRKCNYRLAGEPKFCPSCGADLRTE